MENRRIISILIPYKVIGGNVFVFLQKRAKDVKRLPNMFGFFGGGAEGNENPKEALKREIMEELNFNAESAVHFRKYEFDSSVKDIFFLEVENDFENKVEVLEGDYGKWFGEEDTKNEPKLIEHDKLVLLDFYNFIKNKELY